MRERLAAAPQAGAQWVRGIRRRTPLRVKLVAAMLLLVIAALLGSGIAAATTLRAYLVGRVDAQLASAATSLTDRHGQAGQRDGNDHDGDRSDGLFSDYVTATTDSTGKLVAGPTSNFVDPGRPLPVLPHLRGVHTKRYLTVAAAHGDEQWRVLAAPTTLSDGTAGAVLIAQSLRDVDNTVNRLIVLFVIIGGAAVLILAGVGYLLVRASLRPLREVERTAGKIASGDLSQRVPAADSRTEVGQLAGALNTMLADVEIAFAERTRSEAAARRAAEQTRRSEAAARQSEERMRRFIADASHELRTPLTSIRGFAELYRQGAARDDADVRRAMSRIEDESQRMGLLVEDLLLLARLDQERPLERRPVDLLALAGDAVHDARAVDPNRPITVEVGATDPPPVVIGDEPRLRQVLSNLITNALKHTPPDTPISVGIGTMSASGADDGHVVLTVTDQGTGMEPADAEHIFERFYRADASRSRNDGSTGLGLAIVAALVVRHGGSVDVRTAPGAGASFRVVLPLAALPGVS